MKESWKAPEARVIESSTGIFSPILAKGGYLDSAIEYAGLTALVQAAQALLMRCTMLLWNNNVGQHLADHFFGRPAECLFGDAIPSRDTPIVCHDDDGVENRIENGGQCRVEVGRKAC